MTDYAELYLLNSRNTACCGIGRMIGALIWQIIYFVHLLGRQRHSRWILHHILFTISLNNDFSPDRVLLQILNFEGLGKISLTVDDLLVTTYLSINPEMLKPLGAITGSRYIPDIFNTNTGS